jgi:hypothetical protein
MAYMRYAPLGTEMVNTLVVELYTIILQARNARKNASRYCACIISLRIYMLLHTFEMFTYHV